MMAAIDGTNAPFLLKVPLFLPPALAVCAAAALGYPSIGRVVHRHRRIKRSAYVLTNQRLIATWARGRRSLMWPTTMWPAAKADPPQLIGLPDATRVADLICAAQLAERASTWRQAHTVPR
jgi:hypothetical protein